ncbi:MAG: hypothetical protein LBU31_04530, partial [Coriobacteriales bacterium]|nr:hypothetical protein [Coriobacteriales bacterium]
TKVKAITTPTLLKPPSSATNQKLRRGAFWEEQRLCMRIERSICQSLAKVWMHLAASGAF